MLKMAAMLDRYQGRSYKARLLNPYDALWDCRLRVSTFGYHASSGKPGEADWRVHYTPTPYEDIFRLLRMIDLTDRDVFVDFGAGMGRAVFAASWLGAERAIGIEVIPSLCDKAEESHHRSRLSDRKIEIVRARAQDYRNPEMSICFMFHPFGEATLFEVLRNMKTARQAGPCPKLRIVYVNPVFDFVLHQFDWLRCIGRTPMVRRWPSSAPRYDASLWQSL